MYSVITPTEVYIRFKLFCSSKLELGFRVNVGNAVEIVLNAESYTV